MTEKPLHVRVAEALGWTECRPCPDTTSVFASGWEGRPKGEPYIIGDERAGWLMVPRYDVDWSATGPLIERYEIVVLRDIRSHAKTYCWLAVVGAQDDHGYLDKDYPDEGNAKSPLVAVCNLILALGEGGHL